MCSDRFYLCALTPVERARNDLSFTSSRERDRQTETDRDRQTGREREMQRDIERETHTET